MSIEEHKFSDNALEVVINDTNEIGIHITKNTRGLAVAWLNESDSQAIAKHFNQDRETLVNKIKALIAVSDEPFTNYAYSRHQLQNLINEDLTSEDIDNE